MRNNVIVSQFSFKTRKTDTGVDGGQNGFAINKNIIGAPKFSPRPNRVPNDELHQRYVGGSRLPPSTSKNCDTDTVDLADHDRLGGAGIATTEASRGKDEPRRRPFSLWPMISGSKRREVLALKPSASERSSSNVRRGDPTSSSGYGVDGAARSGQPWSAVTIRGNDLSPNSQEKMAKLVQHFESKRDQRLPHQPTRSDSNNGSSPHSVDNSDESDVWKVHSSRHQQVTPARTTTQSTGSPTRTLAAPLPSGTSPTRNVPAPMLSGGSPTRPVPPAVPLRSPTSRTVQAAVLSKGCSVRTEPPAAVGSFQRCDRVENYLPANSNIINNNNTRSGVGDTTCNGLQKSGPGIGSCSAVRHEGEPVNNVAAENDHRSAAPAVSSTRILSNPLPSGSTQAVIASSSLGTGGQGRSATLTRSDRSTTKDGVTASKQVAAHRNWKALNPFSVSSRWAKQFSESERNRRPDSLDLISKMEKVPSSSGRQHAPKFDDDDEVAQSPVNIASMHGSQSTVTSSVHYGDQPTVTSTGGGHHQSTAASAIDDGQLIASSCKYSGQLAVGGPSTGSSTLTRARVTRSPGRFDERPSLLRSPDVMASPYATLRRSPATRLRPSVSQTPIIVPKVGFVWLFNSFSAESECKIAR